MIRLGVATDAAALAELPPERSARLSPRNIGRRTWRSMCARVRIRLNSGGNSSTLTSQRYWRGRWAIGGFTLNCVRVAPECVTGESPLELCDFTSLSRGTGVALRKRSCEALRLRPTVAGRARLWLGVWSATRERRPLS